MSDYEKQVEEFTEEENMEEDILELVGDDGEVEHFYHLATLEYKKEWYVVLQPTETTETVSEDELLIFRLATDGKTGEDVFMTIDDDKTLNAVYEEYLALVEADDECEDEHCDCHHHHHHDDCDCGCDDGCDCDDDCDCEECGDCEAESCAECEEECVCSGCEEDTCDDCACYTCEDEHCDTCENKR